jgi:DNA-binding PadR family transcriptional regulator
MTSGELVEKFDGKFTSASVYLALKQLRDAKVVETREDTDTGERKNFRVA